MREPGYRGPAEHDNRVGRHRSGQSQRLPRAGVHDASTVRRSGPHLGRYSDQQLERTIHGHWRRRILRRQRGWRESASGVGFAAAATDTGHDGASGSFALKGGRLDWQSIRNNAHVGIHEMTVTGKALTQALYGVAPKFSYFNGCSTGGRQALMEVQRYPQDYHGVVAGAPAINWHKLHIQQMWGPVMMNAMSNPVAGCKLAAATAAVIASCDGIDGVKDGVIEDPKRCTYDPKALVGTSAGECGAFTDGDATAIRRLWEGPRREDGSFLWYGLPRGADLSALWSSRGTPLRAQPFGISQEWMRYFLTQDPQFDAGTLTPAGYERMWDQSVEQYGIVIGTDNADLTTFRDGGGRAIVWHGWQIS